MFLLLINLFHEKNTLEGVLRDCIMFETDR